MEFVIRRCRLQAQDDPAAHMHYSLVWQTLCSAQFCSASSALCNCSHLECRGHITRTTQVEAAVTSSDPLLRI